MRVKKCCVLGVPLFAFSLGLLFSRYFTLEKTFSSVISAHDNFGLVTFRECHGGYNRAMESVERERQKEFPHLAVAACGRKLEEAIIMLKSAVMFTRTFLVMHVFVDSAKLHGKIKRELDSWPSNVRAKMNYTIHNASFPVDVSCDNCKRLGWKSLYKPCSSQRLFLGDILTDVDSVLYVDADVLFLAPIEEFWSIFNDFNSTQFVAAASDTGKNNSGIYHRRRIPFYGPNGVNAGVLLLNLTRLRKSSWTTSMADSLIKYNTNATYFDQDLINIFMHDHPGNSLLLPCEWNYHPEECAYCIQANRTGAALLHGFGNAFGNNGHPPYRTIHRAFKQFKLGRDSIEHDLLPTLKRNMQIDKKRRSKKTPPRCLQHLHVYTEKIEQFITKE